MSSFPTSPRIAVVGSGAVGCYYGGRLAEAGHDVHFLMRSDLGHVRRHGLRVSSIAGDFFLPSPSVHASTDDIGPCDLVLVTLKTTANTTLPALLPPLLHEDTIVLTLQNGLGNEEFLADVIGPLRVLGGLCFVCINRLSPGVIDHTAQGQIAIGERHGPATGRVHALAGLFSGSGVPCRASDSLPAARWKKLAWNIPFNGLAIAAGSVDTAVIMNDPALRQLAEDLIEEVRHAAECCGHPLQPDLARVHLDATLGMAAYKPSSLIDFTEGRDVELHSIWTEPLRRAQAAGASVPRIAMLHALLSQLLRQRRPPA